MASIASSNLSELPLTSRSDPASSPDPVSTCGSSQLPGLPLVSTTNVMTTQTSTLTTPGLASAIVQESLGAAQSSLSGELQVVTPVVPAQLFVSPSLPIDARVSEKLCLKVWNNEYFDFGALLSNPVFDSKYQVTVSNSDKGQMPSSCLEPVARAKKNLSVETWLSCFHIFVGVHTSKYPHEAPVLMKYGEVVQDLAARGFYWKFYDENFRFLTQAQPASFPWGSIHWELWLHAKHSTVKKPQQPPPPARPKLIGQSTPKGYCFKFHKGVECVARCAFKHSCYKCEVSHPVSQCNFRSWLSLFVNCCVTYFVTHPGICQGVIGYSIS